jgi:hypothetical protein
VSPEFKKCVLKIGGSKRVVFFFAQPTTRLVENSGSPKPIICTGELKHIYRHTHSAVVETQKYCASFLYQNCRIYTTPDPVCRKKLMLFQQKGLSIVLTVFYFPHLATLDHIWLSDIYDKKLLGSAR